MITSKQGLQIAVTQNWNVINDFIDKEFIGLPTPIYSSVDIRESKNKIVPVDHNMFPAGFNNICNLDLEACSKELRKTINTLGNYKTLGILTEGHTKNTFYLDHLAVLGKMVKDAGFEVYFFSFDEALFEGIEELSLLSHSKFDILLKKASFVNGEILLGKQSIDLVLLNNDQSYPIDINWDEVAIPVMPVPDAGWFQREKIHYFTHYASVVRKFTHYFNIDPNLLQAKFTGVKNVDFSTKQGMNDLAETVDKFSASLPKNNSIFVKASQGTYGMGISVVSSGLDILNMNRRKRNKMNIGKNNIKFTSLLIQEGIETILEHEGMPAEVSIYLINGKGLGGFMRANAKKDKRSNLNSRGMVLKKYCLSEIQENNEHNKQEALYSIVSRLATLAAALETQEIMEKKRLVS